MTVIVSDPNALDVGAPAVAMELIRYFAASVVALGVDSTLYFVAMRLGLEYAIAAGVGFIGGVTTAYFVSVRWAFRRRNFDNAPFEFLVFLGIGAMGLGLTEALLWLQVGVFKLNPMAAKLVASGGVFIFNFLARKISLFRGEPI